MKKSSTIIAVILLLSICTASGQTSKYDIGLEVGPSRTSLRGNEIIDDSHKATNGFVGGIFLQYNLKKFLSIRSGISYEKKGSEFNIQYPDNSGNPHNWKAKNNFDYLTVPLLIRATLSTKIKLFINGGPFIGILARQTFVSQYDNNPKQTSVNTSGYRKFDIGITSGVGLIIPLQKSILISLEIRNNYGLYNVRGFDVTKTCSLNFLFGLAYRIGQRI